jgi:hypothetical protein
MNYHIKEYWGRLKPPTARRFKSCSGADSQWLAIDEPFKAVANVDVAID